MRWLGDGGCLTGTSGHLVGVVCCVTPVSLSFFFLPTTNKYALPPAWADLPADLLQRAATALEPKDR